MITSSNDQHQPLPDPDSGKCPTSILQTPISLVVSNLSQEQTSGCSASCLHEKRIIRRELQKWGKNVVYLVGFESVAQEFVGPRRWKRIASGLPVCPPSSAGRRSQARDSSPQTETVVIAGEEKEEVDEPVDWDPEKEDCLNCAFRRSKVTLNPEVPDSTDAAKGDSSPVMKQSNDRMCSCDPDESCASCSPMSPASAHDDAVDVFDSVTSSHLLDQLSKVRPSDAISSKGRQTIPNPNYHLLKQLKKTQLTFSSSTPTNSSCDQPLDLSSNSSRAQQLPVAICSSSAATATGQFDQNSLLDVSGSTETALPAVLKRSRETTWKRNYTELELNQALADILAGKLGTRRAAVIYGIPRSTLRNKVYKLGKGSPVGPGRMPGRRPKSVASDAPPAISCSLPKVPANLILSEDSDHVSAENSTPLIVVKKEPSVMPKTRVGRKTAKIRSHEDSQEVSSATLKQMLRENIFNKNQAEAIVPTTDRNNNSSNNCADASTDPGTRDVEPSLLLNSQSLMALWPLLMMNSTPQFPADPAIISDSSHSQTSNPFNSHVADQMMGQSNPHQNLAMFSTLDPAVMPTIAPVIYSYLFNLQRLHMASTAALAASASLSATSSTLSAPQVKSPSSGTGPSNHPSFPPTDPFFQDYMQRLRLLAADSATNETSASAGEAFSKSSGGHEDEAADMDEESDPEDEAETQGNTCLRSTLVNGSASQYRELMETQDGKVDPVILKIPSLKSKRSRATEQGIRCSDKGFEASDSQSLLERNLLSLSSNRSNSYASSVNSEESTGDQSLGKKGTRGGSGSKRVNGYKSGKSGEGDQGSGVKNRPKRGRYRNYDREALDKAVAAVQSGDMSVHRAGTFYGVPHSTLEYKVKQRHLLREKKRPATSTSTTTTAASSNNSSASSPPDSMASHPVPDEPDEKKFRPDSPFQSLLVNDL